MPGVLVPIIVVEDWTRPDGTTPTGMVVFNLLENILSPGYVSANTVESELSFGQIAQQLYANDFDSTGTPINPSTTMYKVEEDIGGAPAQDYYITVPAAPPGSRRITDGVLTQGSMILTSETASFTQDDVRAYVVLPGFPPGTQIATVTSSTTCTFGSTSPLSATDLSVLIGASATLGSLRPAA